MKKALKILSILCLSLAVLIPIGIALLTTEAGTKALLRTAFFLSLYRVDAETIRGKILEAITLEGFKVSGRRWDFTARSLSLNWKGKDLLRREIQVTEVRLIEARFHDRRPDLDLPSDLHWPALPFWVSFFNGKIQSFRVENFDYQRLNQTAIRFDQIIFALDFEKGLLRILDLNLQSPWGRALGSGQIGRDPPSMIFHVDLRGANLFGLYEEISFRLDLKPGEKPEGMAGGIFLWGRRGSKAALRVEGSLGVSPKAIRIHSFQIEDERRQDSIRGEGEIFFSRQPPLRIRVHFSGLDLFPELGVRTKIEGALEARGAPHKYSGKFQLQNVLPGWQRVQIAGTLQGNYGGSEFRNLDGALMGGNLKGSLDLSWVHHPSLKGQFQLRRVDLGTLNPAWKGKVDLDLEGTLSFPPERPPQGILKAKLLESHVFSAPFKGAMTLQFHGEDLRLSPLTLQGPAFTLRAEGNVSERVNLEAQITDPSPWVPNVKGKFHAAGWLRWRKDRGEAFLEIEGQDLAVHEVAAQTLKASLKLPAISIGRIPTALLDLRLEKISRRLFQAESLEMNWQGDLEMHRALFDLRQRRGRVRGEIRGAYRGGHWEGVIHSLEGIDPAGRWTLRSPSALLVSTGRLRLSPLSLRSTKGEIVELASNLSFKPFQGTLQGRWERVDLSRANPWMREGKLAGTTTGGLNARLVGGQMHLSGFLNLQGSFSRGAFHLAIQSGKVNFDWGPSGLQTSGKLSLKEGGKFEFRLASSLPFRPSIPEKGDLEASWQGLNLARLQFFFPPSFGLEGYSSGWMKASWLPGFKVEMTGATEIGPGRLRLAPSQRAVDLQFQRGDLRYAWKERTFQGDFSLLLLDSGWLQSRFSLPIPAAPPWAIERAGPVEISARGEIHGEGLLAAIFPGKIAKSQENGSFSLHAGGTWERPTVKLSAQIQKVLFSLAASPSLWGEERPSAILSDERLRFHLPSGNLDLSLDDERFLLSFRFDWEKKGTLEGRLSSSESSGRPTLDHGTFEVEFSNLNMASLAPLLPESLLLDGFLSGKGNGRWSPDRRIALFAQANVDEGMILWKGEGGRVTSRIHRGEMRLSWMDEHLEGKIDLTLAKYGALEGRFRIPLPARLPPGLQRRGPLHVSLKGEAFEAGLLTALFPGTIEDSRGKLEIDLSARGTWEDPQVGGFIRMVQGGAKFPSLGIHLQGIEAHLRWDREKIRIETLRARSGPGQIEAEGTIFWEGWRYKGFEATLKGRRFQALHLPEFRITAEPRLTLRGNSRKIEVRGEILLPEFLVYREPAPGLIRKSPDVLFTDETPTPKKFPLDLDLDVRLRLGDRVIVNAYGIDARMEGSLHLRSAPGGKIAARGDIRVAEGHYAAYGLRLRIQRGIFSFTEGTLDRPLIDLLATKKIREIEVGIIATGTLQAPIVKLYSSPPLSDTDILSYMILGRPFSTSTNVKEAELLLAAAGALLSRAESVSLQDRIKGFLWLDTVDIQGGSGDFTRSMVTIGKYLTPDLYLSLGYALFENTQVLTLRYKISPQWEVQTQWGTQGGIDLYYKIEFY